MRLFIVLTMILFLPVLHGYAQQVNPYDDRSFNPVSERNKILKNHIRSVKAINSADKNVAKEWFFDAKGNIIKKTIYSDKGNTESETQFIYDNTMRLTSERTTFALADTTETYYTEYSYDETGLKEKTVQFASDGSISLISSFKYNEKRFLIESYFYSGDSSLQNMTNYSYDVMNNINKRLVFKWFEEDWVLINTYVYFFDAQNNLIEVSLARLGNLLWTDVFSYGSKNLLSASKEHDMQDSKYMRNYIYVYDFYPESKK
jgi:hypothetical protein